MKTAFEQLSEAAEEKEYSFTSTEVEFIIEAMKAYAQSAIDEIKEKIVEEARMVYHCGATKKNEQTQHIAMGADNIQVDKESIRSVTIELK